jgi:hypothetical protein
MFAWIGLVQYLDYSAKYSFILKTLSFAVPILARTMVGILPIFIGAVLLSISLFSASFRFHNASYASMNLYSMIAGDELQDVFRDLTGVDLLTALLFLYIYVFFGIAVITNVFIAIAERGFSETKGRSRFEWVKRMDRDKGKEGEDKKDNNNDSVVSFSKNTKTFAEDNNASIARANSLSMSMNEKSVRAN